METFEFKQWTTQDCVKLERKTASPFEIFQLILDKINKVFWSDRENSLTPTEALILVDFSENFSFIFQDKIQSAYWTIKYCMIHPTVFYYKENDKLKSLCIISDDLIHDIQTILSKVIAYIEKNISSLKKVEYFSNRSSGQFKNCTMFYFLCEHEKTFEFSKT